MKNSILVLTSILILGIENNSQAQDSLSTSEMACKSNIAAIHLTPLIINLVGADSKNSGIGFNYRHIINDRYRFRSDVNFYIKDSNHQTSYSIFSDSARVFNSQVQETHRMDFSAGIERGKKYKSIYIYGGLLAQYRYSVSRIGRHLSQVISASQISNTQNLSGYAVQYYSDSISTVAAPDNYTGKQTKHGYGLQIPIGFSYYLTDNFSLQLETTFLFHFDKSKGETTKEISRETNKTSTSTFNFELVPLKFFLAYRF